MKARVIVTLKNGVLDPQGQAIEQALASLSFQGTNSVRQGKVFDVDVEASDPDAARSAIAQMCEQLLVNTVIENYQIEMLD